MKVAPVSFGFDPGVSKRVIHYYRNPAGGCQFQQHPQFAKAQPQIHKDAENSGKNEFIILGVETPGREKNA
jgi:hypothetical protein